MHVGQKREWNEPVGHGTFAVIYRENDVAIKRLRPDVSDSILEREHFLLKQVQGHVNVIRLIERQDDWFSMEYVESNLAKVIEKEVRGSALSKSGQIKGYLVQLLQGIHYCHQAGIIHRDLKPQNILVTNQCIVKIADFGMAARINTQGVRRRKGESIYATSWYRAPELLLYFADYGASVDVWSVGCIFAEMLFGGNALFPSMEGETQQLNAIWSVRGTPNPESFSKAHEKKTVQRSIQKRFDLSDMRKRLSKPINQHKNADLFVPTALDLLEKSLDPNYETRSTALQLMKMDYLTTSRPTPFTLEQLTLARFSQ